VLLICFRIKTSGSFYLSSQGKNIIYKCVLVKLARIWIRASFIGTYLTVALTCIVLCDSFTGMYFVNASFTGMYFVTASFTGMYAVHWHVFCCVPIALACILFCVSENGGKMLQKQST